MKIYSQQEISAFVFLMDWFDTKKDLDIPSL